MSPGSLWLCLEDRFLGGQGRIKQSEEEATVILQAGDNGGFEQGGGMGDEEDKLDVISGSAECFGEDEAE